MAALGCGDPVGGEVSLQSDASTAAVPSSQCVAAQTRACTCAGTGGAPAAGTQACYEGYWLTCACAQSSVPSTVPSTGDCLAGRYEGDFSGLYASGFSFGGLPVPVIAFDPFGGPGLSLTLTANDTGFGEFREYSVSDGFMKGNADGVFPIEGVITGSLNCGTKEFRGTLEGWYSIALDTGTDLNRGFFKGPIFARYDASKHTFVDGTWNVLESSQGGVLAPITTAFQTGVFSPGMLVQNYGGNGDWQAGWVPGDGGVRDAGAVDAGAVDAGSADAGTRDAGP
jgi:hypothetical protein